MRFLDDVVKVVYLILKYQNVALCKCRQNVIYMLCREHTIRAAIQKDGIISVLADLDDRVAVSFAHAFDERYINPVFLQDVKKKLSTLANTAGVANFLTRTLYCDGLI